MKKIKILCAAIILAIILHSCAIKSESHIRERSVKISGKHGQCSGEQVRAPSGVDYILTAGHCKDIQVDGMMTVTDEDGNHLQRRVIGEDPSSDLLLIEGLPGLRGLDIAKSAHYSEHVRTFTHGKGMNTYKTEGELIEIRKVEILKGIITTPEEAASCSFMPKYKVIHAPAPFDMIEACVMSIDEMASTAKVVPGSSGGMVVNDAGDLVGVVSATDDNFNYFITLSDIQRFMAPY